MTPTFFSFSPFAVIIVVVVHCCAAEHILEVLTAPRSASPSLWSAATLGAVEPRSSGFDYLWVPHAPYRPTQSHRSSTMDRDRKASSLDDDSLPALDQESFCKCGDYSLWFPWGHVQQINLLACTVMLKYVKVSKWHSHSFMLHLWNGDIYRLLGTSLSELWGVLRPNKKRKTLAWRAGEWKP